MVLTSFQKQIYRDQIFSKIVTKLSFDTATDYNHFKRKLKCHGYASSATNRVSVELVISLTPIVILFDNRV